jgi:hypothetical protein
VAYKFPKLAPTALTKLRRIPTFARAHRFWFLTASITVVTMLAAFLFGYASLRRAHAIEEQESRVHEVLARLDDWVARYREPTPAESLVWKNSERVMEELQEGAAEPASVAAAVTSRAEQIGIEEVLVRYSAADSLSPPPARKLGRWTLEPQMPTLQVEFVGSFPEVIDLIDALPAHVEVRDLRIARQAGGVRASLTLLAYRATRS